MVRPGRVSHTVRRQNASAVVDAIPRSPLYYATPTCDPSHGLVADHQFHPVLIRDRTDDDVRSAIRAFASGFSGGGRWSTLPNMNCRLFQLGPMDAADLVDGTGNYRTRGNA